MRFINSITGLGLALAIAMSASSTAQATAVVSLTNVGTTTTTNNTGTYGWSFTANANLLVSALGVFDAGSNGLVQSHSVGLWNSAGGLLGSVLVGAGTSGTLSAGFRYANVASTIGLSSGSLYYIGAFYQNVTCGDDEERACASNTEDLYITDQSTSHSSVAYNSITFGQDLWNTTNSLARPNTNVAGSNDGFFGPNFQFSTVGQTSVTVPAVPEPATWAMMLLGFALVGGSLRRRSTQPRLKITFA